MKQILLITCCALAGVASFSQQKKPLDHSVYDSWQSIGERSVSNDGKWVVYAINPQEGDNELVIHSVDGNYKKTISRGYNAAITDDSRYLVFRIRPFYKDAREARIKKKRPDDFPKDSLGILELGTETLVKFPKVKGYKVPEKAAGWVAYHLEKKPEPSSRSENPNKKIDSLQKVVDSLMYIVKTRTRGSSRDLADENYGEPDQEEFLDADEDPVSLPGMNEGTDLVLRKLGAGDEKVFRHVIEYSFSKNGRKLLMETTRNSKDSNSRAAVLLYDLSMGLIDTVSKGGNDFRNFAMSEDGSQVAFVAERDSSSKALQKFYKLWYYRDGLDTAVMVVDKNTVGMMLGMTISENGNPGFSKSGNRLFFGTIPIPSPRDTSLVDIDLVKLDIWHYKDDYLQTQQLYNLQTELRRNYLAVYNIPANSVKQLASKEIPTVLQTNEGDGDYFVGITDFGRRVESQWTGNSRNDIYAIDVDRGTTNLVKKDMQGRVWPSSAGNYILWYDNKAKGYFSWDGDSVRNISKRIKLPLYNEENDVPEEPGAYGMMRWLENDEAVFVYDRYDIWQLDPLGRKNPVNITGGLGRKTKTEFRYVQTDREERFLSPDQPLLFRSFNQSNKQSGVASMKLSPDAQPAILMSGNYSLEGVAKAKDAPVYVYTKETYVASPDIYVSSGLKGERRLSYINAQQNEYNWGTAELFKWKTFSGKETTGILYKPENFDPNKKYPVILYFYERLSDGLYQYTPPQPTGSRLNIPFFVSRGYVVMTPDIRYTIGHPAKSAYDYIVSGAKALTKFKWIDAKNMGIQGQSWGGIQVAQLVHMTDMFKAAWAGAPVANMTSAYGGIRWESGRNRQFQYEKTQSRIGATLWQKPELYIENSPLFHVPKIKTPLVIMHNDADGAVPWYQGIELFTAMRRMDKQVWLLNYNGEAHNLRERKNQKDISIREQQFFDWLLKGEKPAKWIVEGLPAVKKGKDWGLDLVD